MSKRARKPETLVVSIRYTKKEIAILNKEAKKLKLNRSEYIRRMSLEYVLESIPV